MFTYFIDLSLHNETTAAAQLIICVCSISLRSVRSSVKLSFSCRTFNLKQTRDELTLNGKYTVTVFPGFWFLNYKDTTQRDTKMTRKRQRDKVTTQRRLQDTFSGAPSNHPMNIFSQQPQRDKAITLFVVVLSLGALSRSMPGACCLVIYSRELPECTIHHMNNNSTTWSWCKIFRQTEDTAASGDSYIWDTADVTALNLIKQDGH